MSLFDEWNKLIKHQSESTIQDFWKEYAGTEERIYQDILANGAKLSGKVSELVEKYDAKPEIFMGFLDGINSSLRKELKLDDITLDSDIDLDIDTEKLLFNMFKANADYLYGLKEWENFYTPDEYKRIHDEYRRSRTVHVEKKPGRNDPCPCGSGKKYKNCCGKA